MRGSVDGTYEIAHALAREGRAFSLPTEQTETTFDLVVIGGGIWDWRPRNSLETGTEAIARSSYWITTMTLVGMRVVTSSRSMATH